jgi:hypothetical protein
MLIPAAPTFDAFSSLIGPSNPSKRSGFQSFHCAHCLRFRAVACGPVAITLIADSISGGQGRLNHRRRCSFSLRLAEFEPENRAFLTIKYGLYLSYYQCVRLLAERAAILELG